MPSLALPSLKRAAVRGLDLVPKAVSFLKLITLVGGTSALCGERTDPLRSVVHRAILPTIPESIIITRMN